MWTMLRGTTSMRYAFPLARSRIAVKHDFIMVDEENEILSLEVTVKSL
jgi:hypothetical protein